MGPAARFFPILISLSAFGSANVLAFKCGRYCMVASRYNYLPEFFSYIQKQRLTPLPGIILEVRIK